MYRSVKRRRVTGKRKTEGTLSDKSQGFSIGDERFAGLEINLENARDNWITSLVKVIDYSFPSRFGSFARRAFLSRQTGKRIAFIGPGERRKSCERRLERRVGIRLGQDRRDDAHLVVYHGRKHTLGAGASRRIKGTMKIACLLGNNYPCKKSMSCSLNETKFK